jgi:hypothetical protein
MSAMAINGSRSLMRIINRIRRSDTGRRSKAAAGLLVAGIVLGLAAAPALASAMRATTVPNISSITVTGYPKPATPTFTVLGSGFGSRPGNGIAPSKLPGCGRAWAGTGLDYGASNLWMLDTVQSAGRSRAWQAGANVTGAKGNCVGVVIRAWTRSEIVFGLGSTYGKFSLGLASGNTACVEIKGALGCLTLPSTVAATVPSISSITVTGYPQPAAPTFTIQGSGFGSAPTNGVAPSTLGNCGPGWAGTGLDYGTSNLWMLDTAQSVGLYGTWQDGASFTSNNGNCEGVVIQSWTPTEIVFGLSSTYESNSWGLASGNVVCVEVKGVPGCLTLP